MHPPPPPTPNDENRAFPSSKSTSNTPSKMFSYSLPPAYNQSSPFSFQQSNFYTPSKPSPLSSSPLRANRSPLAQRDQNENENPSYSFTMSSPPPAPSQFFGAQSISRSVSAQSTGKRVVKKNPLIHRDEKDGGRETRRKLFLKRVREESEDKRWDKKGGDDELLRSIYVADHKRSIGRNLREDAAYDETPEDFDTSDAQSFNQRAFNSQPSISQPSLTCPISSTAEQQMADEVARQEEAELQAYLEMMEQENSEYQAQQQAQTQQQQPHQAQQPPQYQEQQEAHIQQSVSDDIDYDKMFEDMNMEGAQSSREQGQDNGVPDDEDMMDMS